MGQIHLADRSHVCVMHPTEDVMRPHEISRGSSRRRT